MSRGLKKFIRSKGRKRRERHLIWIRYHRFYYTYEKKNSLFFSSFNSYAGWKKSKSSKISWKINIILFNKGSWDLERRLSRDERRRNCKIPLIIQGVGNSFITRFLSQQDSRNLAKILQDLMHPSKFPFHSCKTFLLRSFFVLSLLLVSEISSP